MNENVGIDLDANDVQEEAIQKYLTFFIDGQYYGISINNVIEIVGVTSIAVVPELPYYAKGIMNLRGMVVPLIDMNLRFGFEEKEYTDRTCIIIMNIRDMEIGFIVDAVDEVANILEANISPPPQMENNNMQQMIEAVAKHNDKVILLLDGEKVLGEAIHAG